MTADHVSISSGGATLSIRAVKRVASNQYLQFVVAISDDSGGSSESIISEEGAAAFRSWLARTGVQSVTLGEMDWLASPGRNEASTVSTYRNSVIVTQDGYSYYFSLRPRLRERLLNWSWNWPGVGTNNEKVEKQEMPVYPDGVWFYSPREAAERLGVSVKSVARWGDQGRIRFLRTAGGHRRYNRHDVDTVRIQMEHPRGLPFPTDEALEAL